MNNLDYHIVRKFLFWPLRLNGQIKWLQFAKIKYIKMDVIENGHICQKYVVDSFLDELDMEAKSLADDIYLKIKEKEKAKRKERKVGAKVNEI